MAALKADGSLAVWALDEPAQQETSIDLLGIGISMPTAVAVLGSHENGTKNFHLVVGTKDGSNFLLKTDQIGTAFVKGLPQN